VVTRVKVILKRVEKSSGKDSPVEDTFYHKQEQRVICFNSESLDLTRAEYELMVTFLSQPSRVFISKHFELNLNHTILTKISSLRIAALAIVLNYEKEWELIQK